MDEWKLAALGRVAAHLPVEDLTLIVLKGHLLVEEQLFAMIRESVVFPDAFVKWRPRYRDISAVAKALFYRPDEGWLWESIDHLNALRNDLVHKLEPKELEERIETVFGRCSYSSWEFSLAFARGHANQTQPNEALQQTARSRCSRSGC